MTTINHKKIYIPKNISNQLGLANGQYYSLNKILQESQQPSIPVTVHHEGEILYHGLARRAHSKEVSHADVIEIIGVRAKTEEFEGIAVRYFNFSEHSTKELVGYWVPSQLYHEENNFRIKPYSPRTNYESNRGWQPNYWEDFLVPRTPGTVAIITDFGDQDTYVGEVRGAIRRKNPHAIIDDITHKVPKFDIRSGSYLLAKASKAYPAQTVFLGVVDPGVGTTREAIAVETWDGNRYVVPNNGLLTHVLNNNQVRATHRIENRFFLGDLYTEKDKTFHGRDIFGPAAGVLASGFPLGWIGPLAEQLIRLSIAQPTRNSQGIITGEIEHVDHYGNIVTNIGHELLEGLKPGNKIVVNVDDRTVEVDFVETYAQTPKGTWVGVITSDHTFEIARNQESANETLKFKAGDSISIFPKQEVAYERR